MIGPRRFARPADPEQQRSAFAVKKLIVSLAAVALVAGTLVYSRTGSGQEPAAAAGPAHQVGLIDMAEVFKKYDKFTTLSEALKKDVEASDAEAKAKVEALQSMQAKLQGGTLVEGSPEYTALEQQLVEGSTQLEAFRKLKQRDFLKKEAEIYKTVYLEVQDMVRRYAQYYKYTVIMRFNRAKVEDAENPQEIINSMNRPVVYYHDQDDITDPILQSLNQQYNKSARPAAAAPANGAPAGGTARAPGSR
jgi:outer membrane protein